MLIFWYRWARRLVNRFNIEVTLPPVSYTHLFRISLSRGKSIIPLADELEHARHYMNIQQIRYKNKFTTQINALPGTDGLYTMKLIVQPILENAIYHGMASAADNGLGCLLYTSRCV